MIFIKRVSSSCVLWFNKGQGHCFNCESGSGLTYCEKLTYLLGNKSIFE